MSEHPDPAVVRSYLLDLQEWLIQSFLALDPRAQVIADDWTRPQGGGGRTRVIRGQVFEQCGINFSQVQGEHLPPTASAQRPELAGRRFEALGVSLVAHPLNPYVPSSHLNVRFFLAEGGECEPVWWFGGGFDLTPYYGFMEDVIHWHRSARALCEPFGEWLYPRLKSWCDEYFFIRHRNEPRGVGGIFFDDFAEGGFDRSFAFARAVGQGYLAAYLPIVERRQKIPYGERERAFQKLRRGRYVEFNLLQDRGTLFGLQSDGRTKSILVSLPPEVSWRYDDRPDPGTPEAELYERFLVIRDWLAEV